MRDIIYERLWFWLFIVFVAGIALGEFIILGVEGRL
jgi:hypothetical protein